MKHSFLILTFFLGGNGVLLPLTANHWDAVSAAMPHDPSQNQRPLTLAQVEALIDNQTPDRAVATDIRERGIAFRLDAKTLESLRRRGAGAQTLQALAVIEERATYEAYEGEKGDPAKRLELGKQFLARYPQSEYAKSVEAGNLKALNEVFVATLKSLSEGADAAKLGRLLIVGDEILSKQPDQASVVSVTTQMALAVGRGMLGDFYQDLEKGRAYASKALKLLDSQSPPPGSEPEEYAKLRAYSLGMLNLYQGLYLLRQRTPDPEGAISLLTKAAEMKDGPSANDPHTYWLRASAYDRVYQKLGVEYRALSNDQRAGDAGKALLAKMDSVIDKLEVDYAQVITLSKTPETRQLRESARSALNALSPGRGTRPGELVADKPGSGGQPVSLVEEWPSKAKRFAVVIGVGEYQDKQTSKFGNVANDARALADALVQYAGFPPNQVTLLTTDGPDRQPPTRSAILKSLASLEGRVPKDGLLLIAFAGHGIERGGKAYLLPADALASDSVTLLQETAISVDRIKELIRATEVSQVAFILDTSRQDPAAARATADNPLTEAFTRGFSFDVRHREAAAFVTLHAAGVGQRAYEQAAEKQGYFTRALVEALSGQAANRKGEVTLGGLVKYLQEAVPKSVQQDLGADKQQRPSALIEGYKADEVVITSADETGPDRGRLANAAPTQLIRAARTIGIRSKTVYFTPGLLENALRHHPEFQALGLTIVSDEKAADLLVDIYRPFFTFTWTFNLTHRQTSALLASGKVSGAGTGSAAAPKLAAELIKSVQALRAPPPAGPKK